MAVGLLEETAEAGVLEWNSRVSPSVAVGDEIVIADVAWFGKTFSSGHEIEVKRPAQDKKAAPKDGCGPDSFAADPENTVGAAARMLLPRRSGRICSPSGGREAS